VLHFFLLRSSIALRFFEGLPRVKKQCHELISRQKIPSCLHSAKWLGLFLFSTEKILPVVKNQHLLLCTLLIGNALAMEVLMLLSDSFFFSSNPWSMQNVCICLQNHVLCKLLTSDLACQCHNSCESFQNRHLTTCQKEIFSSITHPHPPVSNGVWSAT